MKASRAVGSPARRATPPRIVAVGDLNGADDVLVDILRGTGLIDRKLRWSGGRAELVQLGDLFNRGGGARRAFELLLELARQAARAGGRVTTLLGNHEAMTALRNESYCTEEEYLAFATPKERRAWPARVRRAFLRIARAHSPRGAVLPIKPRLEAWKIEHVPGRTALRRELGPRGRLGRELRALPAAYSAQGAVFVHAGLLPEWAELGVSGINDEVRRQWSEAPNFMWMLPRTSVFRNSRGPLWDRSLVEGTAASRAALRRSLTLLGARRMVIGHTQTSAVRGGTEGEILLLHGGRLVLLDVGLRSGAGTPRSALIIEGNRGFEWRPSGTRELWNDRLRG